MLNVVCAILSILWVINFVLLTIVVIRAVIEGIIDSALYNPDSILYKRKRKNKKEKYE